MLRRCYVPNHGAFDMDTFRVITKYRHVDEQGDFHRRATFTIEAKSIYDAINKAIDLTYQQDRDASHVQNLYAKNLTQNY